MTKTNEKLLIGVLAGIIIAGAAAFAIQPALAGSFGIRTAPGLSVVSHDVLTLRLAPRV